MRVQKGNGVIYAWGRNHVGQLGDTTSTQRNTPVPIGLTSVIQIAAGHMHSVALLCNKSLFLKKEHFLIELFIKQMGMFFLGDMEEMDN